VVPLLVIHTPKISTIRIVNIRLRKYIPNMLHQLMMRFQVDISGELNYLIATHIRTNGL
jgi:hypothetical protein